MKQDSLRKKQRGTASPANDFFLSYHIPKENARDFLGSGDFFAAGEVGRRGEGHGKKFFWKWCKKGAGWRHIGSRRGFLRPALKKEKFF
ncbi:hypothetical protein [Evtepia sp.]|uniref:hypothetical protein n=1 Tax=Evtepia sp. TaxID=2773933 RepID=UPI003990CE0C